MTPAGAPGPESDVELSPKELSSRLIKDGFGELLKDKEIREACCKTLADAGLAPPLNHFAVFAIGGALGFAAALAGEKAMNVLAHLAETTPGVRVVFAAVVRVCASCMDRTQLRSQMLAALRGEVASLHVEVNSATPLEVLAPLRTEQRLDRLQAEMRAGAAAIAQAFEAWFEAFYDPILTDPSRYAPSEELAASLKFTAERDEFVGRRADLDLLHRFIGDETLTVRRRPVLWQLLTGPGGLGKSRIALHFMREARTLGWAAGFLRDAELARLDPARWRPRRPTVMIIDYPARAPGELRRVLSGLAASQDEFLFPVRLLLLERRADSEWFRQVCPPVSEGDLIRDIQFTAPHELSPLAQNDLASLMRRRLPVDSRLGDDDLLTALRRVDDRTADTDSGRVWAPRPLFAAAVAEMLGAAGDHLPLTRVAVLDHILDREEYLWGEVAASTAQSQSHQALLALSCLCLGLDRAALADLPDPGRLPSLRANDGRAPFDPDLFARMSGAPCDAVLNSLEPDLLGERYVLRFLARTPEARAWVVDTALAHGGDDAAVFVARAAADFPRAETLDLLTPSPDAPPAAFRRFALASIELTGAAKDSLTPDQVEALWARLRRVGEAVDDPETRGNVAKAGYNHALHLGDGGDLAGARAVFDWLRAFAAEHGEHEPRVEAAKAGFNLALDLGDGGDLAGARAVFDWLRAFAAEHGEPGLCVLAAEAGVNLALHLGRGGDFAGARAVSDWLRAFAAEHGEPELRVVAAQAGINLALHLGGGGDLAGARAVFDWLRAFAAEHGEPELRVVAAQAGINLALHLGGGGDLAGARAVFDWLRAFAAEHGEPEPRVLAAKAGVNLALDLGDGGDLAGARAVFDWLRAFAAEHGEPKLRVEAAKAGFNLALHLGRGGDLAGARAVFGWLRAFAAEHGEPEPRVEAAKAGFNLALHLGRGGDLAGARAVFDWLRAFAAEHGEPELRVFAAMAGVNLAGDLGDGGDLAGAREIFDWLRAFAAEHGEPEPRVEAAKAGYNLALHLGRGGDLAGARAVCDWLRALAEQYPEQEDLREIIARISRWDFDA